MTRFNQSAGVLLHPTSLPGPHGTGDLGPSAEQFLNGLSRAGLSWWQMLPITPPGYGESPYNSLSAFAGNPYLISLESLTEDGLLSPSDLSANFGFPQDRVDFGAVKALKDPLFRKAFAAHQKNSRSQGNCAAFRKEHGEWIDDFALFMAVKNAQGGRAWTDWPDDLRKRRKPALERAARELSSEFNFHVFLQWTFERQWAAFRKKARAAKIQLIGDIPIFVAPDSADVWAHQALFKLDPSGHPSVVAGVPPDYFSPTGQRWGNPVYKWPAHRKDDFTWWIKRIGRTLALFDAIRLDHFIGFYRTWEIPAAEPTAINGRWSPGPRTRFFETVQQKLNRPPLIAEDLGNVIPPIHRLRKTFELPGMFVLHFAFGDGVEASLKRLKKIPPQTVIYTGTHDNDTSRGWFTAQGGGTADLKSELRTALEILKTDGQNIHWDLIRLALSSRADLAIVPCQDLLGLDGSARMNRPGTSDGNWTWRMTEQQWTDDVENKIRTLVSEHERLP